jgi:hypothetical protein
MTPNEAPGKPAEGVNPSIQDAVAQGKAAVTRWKQAIKGPVTGATVTGAVVLGAVLVFGFAEAAVGAGAAYVAYRILKKRRRDQ